MKAPTVQQLREAGCRVRVDHQRVFVPRHPDSILEHKRRQIDVSPCGGTTKVKIEFPSGDIVSGEAHCSIKDNYNKKLGVRIAIGRALSHLPLVTIK